MSKSILFNSWHRLKLIRFFFLSSIRCIAQTRTPMCALCASQLVALVFGTKQKLQRKNENRSSIRCRWMWNNEGEEEKKSHKRKSATERMALSCDEPLFIHIFFLLGYTAVAARLLKRSLSFNVFFMFVSVHIITFGRGNFFLIFSPLWVSHFISISFLLLSTAETT